MIDQIKKTRLLAMGLSASVALVCFGFGAVWVRTLHNSMDQSRLNDAGREIRSRMTVIRQLVLAEMASLTSTELWHKLRTDASNSTLEKIPDPFDVVVMYSETRQFLGGVQRIGKERTLMPLSAQLVKTGMPGDSTFFDRAAGDGNVSGLLVFQGRPLVIGVKHMGGAESDRGYILAGRWLDSRRLAPTAGMTEQAFDVFVPDDRVGLPADVDSARLAMKSDEQFFGRLQRRGAGVGYLRFDDVFERTAFILRFPWVDAGPNGEQRSLMWLFVASVLIGISLHLATSVSLGWIETQRRRSPGLSGMTDHELREMVESFPGYAFAVNQRQEYIAISRALAGVSGKEPVYFVGRLFGSVSGESGMKPSELMTELSGSNHWPSTKTVDFSIAGLREQFDYSGSCHYVTGRRILFVVLQASEQAIAPVVPHLEKIIDTNTSAAA